MFHAVMYYIKAYKVDEKQFCIKIENTSRFSYHIELKATEIAYIVIYYIKVYKIDFKQFCIKIEDICKLSYHIKLKVTEITYIVLYYKIAGIS